MDNYFNKYEQMKSLLQNGDVCFFQTWDYKLTHGMYMDGYLYKTQINNIVVSIGGFEPEIVKISRPACIRNSFQLFRYNDEFYDCDVSKYGKFETIYSEID